MVLRAVLPLALLAVVGKIVYSIIDKTKGHLAKGVLQFNVIYWVPLHLFLPFYKETSFP